MTQVYPWPESSVLTSVAEILVSEVLGFLVLYEHHVEGLQALGAIFALRKTDLESRYARNLRLSCRERSETDCLGK